MNLTELTEAHYQAIKQARANLKGCPVCHGKPQINREPGCVYTYCIMKKENCPCKAAAPDFEIDLLTQRIHAKIQKHAEEKDSH